MNKAHEGKRGGCGRFPVTSALADVVREQVRYAEPRDRHGGCCALVFND